MPPHCDALDGPVVTAAREALLADDVDIVLPFVHAEGEHEIRNAFDQTMKARAAGGEAADVADRWFFETVVRVHRAGEGAPYTGLKPAGLDVGPVIPVAERALEDGDLEQLVATLCAEVREQVEHRHGEAMARKARARESLEAQRAYVEAALGLQVWSNGVHRQLVGSGHAHGAHQG